MRKVGIIGLGNVGEAVAHYIFACGFADDIVLIDHNTKKANADAYDFEDALPNLPHHINLTVNDYSALKNADVIISAIGNMGIEIKTHGNRFSELVYNAKQVREIGKKIKASGFHGIIIVITNPVDVITTLYQRVTGFPKSRVIGTGTLLDTARMKKEVAKILNIDPRSVSGFNLGEHGNSQFTAFSTVKALGQSFPQIAKSKGINLDQVGQQVKKDAFTVFSGKHYTNYGVATAAVRLMNIILNDARSEVPVSNFRKDLGVYLSYPVIVGRNGVIGNVKLNLTDDEKQKLSRSANFIKKETAKYLK